MEMQLKAASPKLTVSVVPGDKWQISHSIRDSQPPHVVESEGYSTTGAFGPTYWRIVQRDGKRYYCSTVTYNAAQVRRVWGDEAMVHCDDTTGRAIILIESNLPDRKATP